MKVFISHSSTDKKFVRKMKEDLNENDIQTWFDEDELNLGDNLLDKLSYAIEETSHLVVVLSKASVSSHWVQIELEKAFKLKNANLSRKIIPVKYKECEIPADLKPLLYWDLSKEIRQVIDDKIEFSGPGYLTFLEKLCNSIRANEKTITLDEKAELKKDIQEINQKEVESQSFVQISYLVIGFRSSITREDYSQKITTNRIELIGKEVRPVLLPPLLKPLFKSLKIGDALIFTKNFAGYEVGHFAGFRKDDLAITLDYRIRKGIFVKPSHRYRIEIDIETRKFHFISK